MTTTHYRYPPTASPVPLKRGVVAALVLGTVLGRIANLWSRV
ncbi:MAG TPA: hypothetical protein VFM41_08455 [Gaiella sp.]|nr:hypothetical protein [Gaiella sp.]